MLGPVGARVPRQIVRQHLAGHELPGRAAAMGAAAGQGDIGAAGESHAAIVHIADIAGVNNPRDPRVGLRLADGGDGVEAGESFPGDLSRGRRRNCPGGATPRRAAVAVGAQEDIAFRVEFRAQITREADEPVAAAQCLVLVVERVPAPVQLRARAGVVMDHGMRQARLLAVAGKARRRLAHGAGPFDQFLKTRRTVLGRPPPRCPAQNRSKGRPWSGAERDSDWRNRPTGRPAVR